MAGNGEQERWKKIESLFHRALALTTWKRTSFLFAESPDNSALRRSVAGLLSGVDSGTLRLTLGDDAVEPERALSPGQIVGNFGIIEKIGVGGMGSVWLAEDLRLERKVAIKLLHGLVSPHADLLSEAKAASQLNHPNIVTIYDFGEFEGRPYIVSEYVEGVNLRKRLDGTPLPFAEIKSIVTPFLSMLKTVHSAGIVHRDIKPENILITRDGLIKLTDFGLATRVDTVSGDLFVGTPAYMSPEQIRGEPADTQTDLWSFGILLFEMASGERPFRGASVAETFRAIENEPLPRIGEPCIPGLEEVIRKQLDKDKSHRYKCVTDIERDLLEIFGAQDAGNAGHGAGFYLRWAGVVFLLLVLSSILWMTYRRPAAAWFTPTRTTRITSTGDVLSAAISPDGKWIATANDKGAEQLIQAKNLITGETVKLNGDGNFQFRGLAFSPNSNDLYYLQDNMRDFRTLYSAKLPKGPSKKLLDDIDSPPAFSPDGKQIVFTRDDPANHQSLLMVARSDGSDSRVLSSFILPRRFSFNGADWTTEGKSVLCGVVEPDQRSRIAEVNLTGAISYPVSQFVGWIGRISRLGGRGSGQFLVSLGETGDRSAQIYELDLPSRTLKQITAGLDRLIGVSTTADGKQFATVEKGRVSSIWIRDSSGMSERISPDAAHLYGASWTSAGGILTQDSSGTGGSAISTIKVDGSDEHPLIQSAWTDWKAKESSDGRYVGFISNRGGAWHVWRSKTDGSDPRPVTSGQGETSFDWSPDSRWIYYQETADGRDQLRRISLAGGSSQAVSQIECREPVVSSDEKIACECRGPEGPWKLGWVDMQSGTFHSLNYPGKAELPYRWAPAGGELTLAETTKDVSNLFNIEIATGRKKQITGYEDQQIFEFDWDRLGKRLALVRGRSLSNALLITGTR